MSTTRLAIALPIAVPLAVVGPREPTGWRLAEQLTPVTPIAWSPWLVATGVALVA